MQNFIILSATHFYIFSALVYFSISVKAFIINLQILNKYNELIGKTDIKKRVSVSVKFNNPLK